MKFWSPLFRSWWAPGAVEEAAAGYIIARHYYERMWLANQAQHAYERTRLHVGNEPRDP